MVPGAARDPAVAEAQAVLQRRLVEFLRWWSQELLLSVSSLHLVESLRALSARAHDRPSRA